MCRLTAYKGDMQSFESFHIYQIIASGLPILIGDVITHPNNSLLCQSRDAAYHPGVIDKSNRRNIIGTKYFLENVSLIFWFTFSLKYYLMYN